MSDIVPFGKYKGQPLEIMLSDAGYVAYQKQQPGFMRWLQENHITIYNVFTTGAQQVQDTPEHNRLQARFLDKKFQLAFIDVVINITSNCTNIISYLASTSSDIDEIAAYKAIADNHLLLSTRVSFEHGYDVALDLVYDGSSYKLSTYFRLSKSFRIELKPHVGDDYPAVLRQMKINQREGGWIDVLVIGTFESESITLEQLRGIFGRYRVVMLSEIEEKLQTYK